DALAEAHRAFPAFQGSTVAEFTAWLRAIALRSAGRALREHLAAGKRDAGREKGLADAAGLADAGSSPSQTAARHEESARLAAALARLPEEMQQVLLGRHMDGLPHAALADKLGR